MTILAMTIPLPYKTFHDVRQALLAGQEMALIDLREEDPFAQAHPLFAANLPAGRIELDAWRRIPRLDTTLVLYDNGENLGPSAARTFRHMGYTEVFLLEGGLTGWLQAGGEVFKDVNVPSKAFGELVESQCHTPSLSAEEVNALLTSQADVVVLDARRFEEFQTMSIPGGISVPGAELVLRAGALAPDPATRIIVNCAGRTRSIIGTQSLLNAGISNQVCALRNGTIGWTLAGLTLNHFASQRFGDISAQQRTDAAQKSRLVADRAGVKRAGLADLALFAAEKGRTTYLFDVRTPEEFVAAHLPGFSSAPGGQLVQETDVSMPVRGARVVLFDLQGARADMSASWLAQMGWDVWVLDDATQRDCHQTGHPQLPVPLPERSVAGISAAQLNHEMSMELPGLTIVLDVSSSVNYVQGHVPGACFVLRSELPQGVGFLPVAPRYVVTCESDRMARFAASDLVSVTASEVLFLEGGTTAWRALGLALEEGETRLMSPRIDRYRRPYEGTGNPREAMQGYLDWEFGLIEQLNRDGTHRFTVMQSGA